MKLIGLIITIAIIIISIKIWNQGEQPTWVMYFIGWACVLINDIMALINERKI